MRGQGMHAGASALVRAAESLAKAGERAAAGAGQSQKRRDKRDIQ